MRLLARIVAALMGMCAVMLVYSIAVVFLRDGKIWQDGWNDPGKWIGLGLALVTLVFTYWLACRKPEYCRRCIRSLGYN